MADLKLSSISGTVSVSGGIYPSVSDVTPWYRLYHCADGTDTSPVWAGTWLHIRTPLPATNAASGSGWNPSIVEVMGFHTYSGDWTHDFKAIINSSGYADNTWYGSQIRCNAGNDTATENLPFVYRSINQYGGYERVCIAVKKVGCCCVGWIWIRWWNNTNWFENYAWATVGRATNAAYY